MSNNALTFYIQHQQESNWCWAACAASISMFYNHQSSWTQCRIVSAVRNADCCTNPEQADDPGRLDIALSKTLNLYPPMLGVIIFQHVQMDIDAECPLGVQITWASGGAHFICIFGYDDSSSVPFFYIADPLYKVPNNGLIAANAVFKNYCQPGSFWSYTIRTKGENASLPAQGAPSAAPNLASPHVGLLQFAAKTDLIGANTAKEAFSIKLPNARSRVAEHDFGYVTLKAIDDPDTPIQVSGIRIPLKFKKREFLADFKMTETGKYELERVTTDQDYVKLYYKLWRRIAAFQRKQSATYKVIFLRQPELGVEAFLIRTVSTSSDDRYLLFDVDDTDKEDNAILDKASFYQILKQKASAHKAFTFSPSDVSDTWLDRSSH